MNVDGSAEAEVADTLANVTVTLSSSEWAKVVGGLRFLSVMGSPVHAEPAVKIAAQVERVIQDIANASLDYDPDESEGNDAVER